MVTTEQLTGTIEQVQELEGELTIPRTITETVWGVADVVQGTFTTDMSFGDYDIYIDYHGTGYPIAALIVAEADPSGADYYHDKTGGTVLSWAFSKNDKSIEPDYDGDGILSDLATISVTYRRHNATGSNDYVCSVDTAGSGYRSSWGATGRSPQECAYFRGHNMLSYYCSGGAEDYYGLALETTYRFIIAYSSTEEG